THHGEAQSSFIAPAMARKQNTHSTIGPDAPLNLKPRPSNSIGPEELSRNTTINRAARADDGRPIVAGKCSIIVLSMRGSLNRWNMPPKTKKPPKRIPAISILRQSRRYYDCWPLKGA